VGSRNIRGGVDGVGTMHLREGIVYIGLLRIVDFFFLALLFYKQIMFVKVMNQ
jgi:hypothetical protein